MIPVFTRAIQRQHLAPITATGGIYSVNPVKKADIERDNV
jgi:hypothetical protein